MLSRLILNNSFISCLYTHYNFFGESLSYCVTCSLFSSQLTSCLLNLYLCFRLCSYWFCFPLTKNLVPKVFLIIACHYHYVAEVYLYYFLYHLIMVARREEKYVLLANVIWTKSCLIFLFLIVWSIGKLTFFIWKVEGVVINISLSSEEINIVFRYNSKTARGFPIVFVSFLLNKDVILRVNVTYFLGCCDLIFIQYWILLWNIGLQMVL